MKTMLKQKSGTRQCAFGRRKCLRWPVAGLLLVLVLTAAAQRPNANIKPDLNVMTANLYVGGDIGSVMALDPSDPNYMEEVVGAVTEVYAQIAASDPPDRLQTLAKTIALRMPDIVAVEEASLIREQSPGDMMLGGTTPATNVVYDYVQILLKKLQARGAHYKLAVTATEVDVELPMMNASGGFDDVRLTDREAILVRADQIPAQFRVSNPRQGNFANVIPLPGLGLSVERGWCSVDVFAHGKNVRCIGTHLEEETAPGLQVLQLQELLAGPANTSLPVIVVGDFNTDPLHRDGSVAYDLMPAAGFGDAWATLHASTPAGGLTWGHDASLADPTTPFDRRIDFAFYRGRRIVPAQVQVFDLKTGLSQAPLWFSDHAALVAGFMLK